MAKIYPQTNYNAAADSVKVGWIKVPSFVEHLASESGPQIVKAFRIIDNVWLVPERYRYGDKPEKMTVPSGQTTNTAYYDEKYLTTKAQKDTWLSNMTAIFQRLGGTNNGKKLLDIVNLSTPMSRSTPQKYIKSNSITVYADNKATTGKVSYPASLIIYGPGRIINRIVTFPCGRMSRADKIYDLHGYLAEMVFAPDILALHSVTEKTRLVSIYAIDPAVSLAHELTHSIRMAYGMIHYAPGVKNKFRQVQMEETIAVDYEYGIKTYKETIEYCKSDYFNIYKSTLLADLIYLSKQTSEAGKEAFNRFKLKYKANYDGKEVTVNKDTYEEIYKLVVESSENSIAKELKVFNDSIELRKSYSPVTKKCISADLKLQYNKITGLPQYHIYKNDELQTTEYKELKTGSGPLKTCKKSSSGTFLSGDICIPIFDDIYQPIDKSNYEGNSIEYTITDEKIEIETFTDKNLLDIEVPIIDSVAVDAEDTAIEDMEPPSIIPIVDDIETEDFNIYHNLTANDITGIGDLTPLEMLDFNNDNISKALENKGTVLNLFPNVKTALGKVETVSNYLGAALWANSVYEAYKNGTTQEVVEAGVSIVPYVGPLINFYKGNFVQAFKDTALQTLFIVQPQLFIPVIAVSFLLNLSDNNMSNDNLYDNYIEIINNVNKNAKNFINNIVSYYINQWQDLNVQIGNNMQKALQEGLYQQDKIISHMIEYNLFQLVAKKVIESDQATDILEQAMKNLRVSSNLGGENINKMISQALITNFLENTNITPYLTSLNDCITKLSEEISVNFSELLKKDGTLTDDQKKSLTNAMGTVLRDYKNISMTKEELLDYLSDETDIRDKAYMDICCDSVKQPSSSEFDNFFYDRLDSNTKIEIHGSKSYLFDEARSGYCLTLVNKDNLKKNLSIENDILAALTVESNFSISFWMRLPILSSDLEFGCSAHIFRLNINKPDNIHDTGLGVNLDEGKISVTWLQDDLSGALKYQTNVLSKNIIADNRWHLIQIDLNNKKLSLSIDGELNDSNTISSEAKEDYPMNNNMIVGLINDCPVKWISINNIRIFADPDLPKSPDELFQADMDNGIFIYDYWGNAVRNNRDYHLVPVSKLGLESWLQPINNKQYQLMCGNINMIHNDNYKLLPDLYAGQSLCLEGDTDDHTKLFNNSAVESYLSINESNIDKNKFYMYSQEENQQPQFNQKKYPGSKYILQKIDNVEHSQKTSNPIVLFTADFDESKNQWHVYGALKTNENNKILQGVEGRGDYKKYERPDISNVPNKQELVYYLVPEDSGWPLELSQRKKSVLDTNGAPVRTGIGYYIEILVPLPKVRKFYAYSHGEGSGTYIYGSTSSKDAYQYYFGYTNTSTKDRVFDDKFILLNDRSRYWKIREIVWIFYPNGGIYLDENPDWFSFTAGANGFTLNPYFYFESNMIVRRYHFSGLIELRFRLQNY